VGRNARDETGRKLTLQEISQLDPKVQREALEEVNQEMRDGLQTARSPDQVLGPKDAGG